MRRITSEEAARLPAGSVIHTASGLYTELPAPKTAARPVKPEVKEVADEPSKG